MAIQKIRIYGDPCLKAHAERVEYFDQSLRSLARDMGETMYANRGIGLAASQIGVNLRVFVMDLDWVDEENGEQVARRNLRVFANPEIVEEASEDEAIPEACLSLPDLEGEVFRPVWVKLRWQDEAGRFHEEKMEGLRGRCVQHEGDHLDGILFIDRMPFAQRRLLAGKLQALKKTHAQAAAV
ncbi:peptide deformylase [bacterium]|nr:peptide deformylase [bacterium]